MSVIGKLVEDLGVEEKGKIPLRELAGLYDRAVRDAYSAYSDFTSVQRTKDGIRRALESAEEDLRKLETVHALRFEIERKDLLEKAEDELAAFLNKGRSQAEIRDEEYSRNKLEALDRTIRQETFLQACRSGRSGRVVINALDRARLAGCPLIDPEVRERGREILFAAGPFGERLASVAEREQHFRRVIERTRAELRDFAIEQGVEPILAAANMEA